MTERDEQIAALERRNDLNSAALGAAEDIGGLAAVLAGVLVQSEYSRWWLSVLVAAVAYVFVTHRYRKAASLSEDAWYKAAGLGKYWTPEK